MPQPRSRRPLATEPGGEAPPRVRPALPWFAWIAAPLFAVGATLALGLLLDGFGSNAPPVFAALVFLTGCAFVGLLVSALSFQRSLIDLCYYLYLAYFLLAPAAMQVAVGRFPWQPVVHEAADTVHTTWLIALAMIGYEVGRFLHRRRLPPVSTLAAPAVPTGWLLTFAVGCSLVGLAVIPLIGVETLLASRGDLATLQGADTRTTYQVFLSGQGLALAGAVVAVALFVNRGLLPPGSWLRPMLTLLVLGAVPLALFLYNPLANARFVFAGCLLALFYVTFRGLFQRTKTLLIIAFPLIIFYVLPAIKLLGSAEGRSQFFDVLLTRRFDYFYTVDFDTFQASANVVRFVDLQGLLGLQNLFGVPFFFVPRGLWSGKPMPSGATVFEQLGYWYTNVSTPLFMEFYLAAGLLAVPLGMMLVGWLVARVEVRASLGGMDGSRTGGDVVVALVGGFTIIVMRGALAGIMAWVGPPIAAALVVLLLLARRRAPSPAATEAVPVSPARRLGQRWSGRVEGLPLGKDGGRSH